MTITITLELPDHFTDSEVEDWKNDMTKMAAFYVQAIIGKRGDSDAKSTESSVRFESIQAKPE